MLRDYRSFFPPETLRLAGGVKMTAEMSYEGLREIIMRFYPHDEWLTDVLEYRPRWSVTQEGFGIMPEAGPPAGFVKGGGEVTALKWAPQRKLLRIKTPTGGTLLVRAFYYPGWKVSLDGKELQPYPNPENGLMLVDVPPGEYTLKVRFKGGKWHTAGRTASGASLFALLISGLYLSRPSGRKPISLFRRGS